MDSCEIREQFECFGQTLNRASRVQQALDGDFVRRFNEFVAAYPHVLEWKLYENGATLLRALFDYLWRAIYLNYPFATWKPLVIQAPQVLAEITSVGWTLLHCICWYNRNVLVPSFVEQYPDAAKMKNHLQNTPLHLACEATACLPTIRVLVGANPLALYSSNKHGNSPLHCACRCGTSLDVIRYFVMEKPGICLHRNNNDNLPLDEAKKRQPCNRDVVEFMTTATKAAANVLLKRFCLNGLPHELFEMVAAYHRQGAVLMVTQALFRGEIAVLFRRNDVREEFLAQIHAE